MLPYWEGVKMETAADYIIDKMDLLENDISRQAGGYRRSRLAEQRPNPQRGGGLALPIRPCFCGIF